MNDRAFDFSLSSLLPLAWKSVPQPRVVVRQMIGLGLPAPTLWLMLMTIATVSVLLGQGASLLLVSDAAPVDSFFLGAPLVMAAIQWGIIAITAQAMHHIGALMGGQGRFEDSLAALTWLQFIMFGVQILQTVALFLLPPLVELVTLGALILLLWLFTNFVAEVHGFRNLGLVFVMIIVSTFAISFALTLVLSILGVSLGGLSGA